MKISFASLIRKTVLAGLTCKSRQGHVAGTKPLYGQIEAARSLEGITVRIPGQEDCFVLPPGLAAFRPAEKGIYFIKCTRETGTDPDFIST